MRTIFIFFFVVLFSFALEAKTISSRQTDDENGLFSGRVSRVNREVELIRVRLDFLNAKFINTKEFLEFWYDHRPDVRCRGRVEGKSNRYILVKVSNYERCVKAISLTAGSLLYFYSSDLARNIHIAEELINILFKKRLALLSKKDRYHKELSRFIERVEAVNERYIALREKLELEWEKEISKIEEDKAETIKNYQDVENRLESVENKLKRYRIHDENFTKDRWSLDPELYQKK